jgi:hypothetical protein
MPVTAPCLNDFLCLDSAKVNFSALLACHIGHCAITQLLFARLGGFLNLKIEQLGETGLIGSVKSANLTYQSVVNYSHNCL